MKIKEVIEKTNLTDRAIRLYIDNGLVSPGIEENYSGRKNIEFSENDVERLNQIALLRKAGFSIFDIKEIISDNEKIEEIVRKFIEETDEEIRSKSEVLERLKSISFDEKISLKTLCEKLSETVEKMNVPEEDLKDRKIERIYFKSFGIAGMVYPVIAMTTIFILLKKEFVHLSFNIGHLMLFLLFNAGLLLTIFIGLTLFMLNRKKGFEKRKRRKSASNILMLLGIPIAVISLAPSVILSFLFFPESMTTDTDDYMVVDSFVKEFEYGEEIDSLFPDEIPLSAKINSERYPENSTPFTTKYYYRYSCFIDPDIDIVAEWKLSDDEYKESKKNAEKIGNYETIKKGEWTCLYFEKTNDEKESWEDDNYFFLIFAYNDKTNMVRYITSYAINSMDYGPYYLSLDW